MNTGEIIRPNFFEIPDNQSDNKLINKYLLTFNTKLQVFYAVLNKINHTNPNVECDFYQGRIISPDPNGFIAATICMDNFNQSILVSIVSYRAKFHSYFCPYKNCEISIQQSF